MLLIRQISCVPIFNTSSSQFKPKLNFMILNFRFMDFHDILFHDKKKIIIKRIGFQNFYRVCGFIIKIT